MSVNATLDIVNPTRPKGDAHGFVYVQMRIGNATKLMKYMLQDRPMGIPILNDGADVICERLETGVR